MVRKNELYNWTDNPTVSGESVCDTDVLNECLMHLKYDKNDSGSGLNLFDIVQKDHFLSYEESEGFAILGSYVYKDPISDFSYGYPDFYEKCLEEKAVAVASQTVLGNNTITTYTNSNGHVYYDISDKDAVDEFYTIHGACWMYGVDEDNERIFLPRNDWFFQNGTSDNVGSYTEAGLPNIMGSVKNGYCSNETAVVSGAFYSNNNTSGSNIGGSNWKGRDLNFNASLSNPIYGNSDTVQPNAVHQLFYMVVGSTSNIMSTTVELASGSAAAPLNFDTETGEIQLNYSDGLAVAIDGSLTIDCEKVTKTGMPSTRYIDLTLGGTGSVYTAPATGWFVLSKTTGTKDSGRCEMYNLQTSYGVTSSSNNEDNTVNYLAVPCLKNEQVSVIYNINGTTNYFKFVYAEGAQ